jgi:hypothetical protein
MGVYVMLPRNELPEDHRLLGHESFAGFRLFMNWRDLQPEMHTLDWSRFDIPIKRAKAWGQKIFISINFGKGAPDWVYSNPHPCAPFTFDMKGTPSVMPFGFDQAYQRKVDDFLAQLAFRYDDEETISGFAMTGAGTLGIEFHVCETDEDIANWEEAAMEANYAHKHDAIQECTWRRIDSWADLFSATTIFFCRGNPWSNPSGTADEEAMMAHAKTKANGGICSEFLKANAQYNEDLGLVLNYPYTEEPVAPSSSPAFYRGYEEPFPEAPEPVHALLMSAYNLGATMCELWEVDALNPANHETIAADSLKLISNVPA